MYIYLAKLASAATGPEDDGKGDAVVVHSGGRYSETRETPQRDQHGLCEFSIILAGTYSNVSRGAVASKMKGIGVGG